MSRYIRSSIHQRQFGSYDGFGNASASAGDIRSESTSMTAAQKIKAAEETTKAIGELMAVAGPIFSGAVKIFGDTVKANPELFTPAVNSLLAIPFLPQPVKDGLKNIVDDSKRKAPGPKPSTPNAPRTVGGNKTKWVIGGAVGLGLLAVYATRKKKK